MSKNRAVERGEPLSTRPFFTIWTGQAFSLLGSSLVQFALVWWLTKVTGSATVLATAAMMALLPQVFIGPIAGALVDRWNRRRVMIVADSLIALAVVLLAGLFAFDRVQIWHIYILMFVRAVGAAFHWPAMQASTSLMVPERHLSRVAGLNQALQGLASIMAPPLGALLLETVSMQATLSVDVATALLAIVPLLFVHVPQPAHVDAGEGESKSSVTADLREGLRFLRGWPGMLMVIGIAMIINLLLHPAMSLQPLLITNRFSGGALELAWMQCAFGVGFVAGGITLSAWGGFKRRAMTALLGLILNGLALALVGLTPASALWLAIGAMFFAGFMNVVVNGSMFAMLQAIVPPEVQGRVFTVVLSGAGAVVPVGLAIAGPVADALGVHTWFVAGGAIMAILGAGALFVPAIVHIEDRVLIRDEVGEALEAGDTGLADETSEVREQHPATVPATAQ